MTVQDRPGQRAVLPPDAVVLGRSEPGGEIVPLDPDVIGPMLFVRCLRTGRIEDLEGLKEPDGSIAPTGDWGEPFTAVLLETED